VLQTSAHRRSLFDRSNHPAGLRLSRMSSRILHRRRTNIPFEPALSSWKSGGQADASTYYTRASIFFSIALHVHGKQLVFIPVLCGPSYSRWNVNGACNFHQGIGEMLSGSISLSDKLGKVVASRKKFFM
jgi:hypothetical protein